MTDQQARELLSLEMIDAQIEALEGGNPEAANERLAVLQALASQPNLGEWMERFARQETAQPPEVALALAPEEEEPVAPEVAAPKPMTSDVSPDHPPQLRRGKKHKVKGPRARKRKKTIPLAVEDDLPQEVFGTEPPAPGWSSRGEGRWTRDEGPEVCIVGGGPGGLFAAYLLNQRFPTARITILEASDRLGGKIQTDHFSDGTPFEAGVAELYEYLGPGGKDPLRTLIEKDLGLITVNMNGGCVIIGEMVIHSIDEIEEHLGHEAAGQVKKFYKTCSQLMPLAKFANRWQPDNAHPWAKKTFKECLYQEVDDPEARDYILTAIHSDLATESHVCNGLNGLKNALMDNNEYMQLYHVVDGIERVVDELSQRLQCDVRLGSRALAIRRSADRYKVTFTNEERRTTGTFDSVVVCLPNHWLTQIDWGDERLTEAFSRLQEHYDEPAHYLRISLLYDERWWDRLEIDGDFWMMDILNGACAYDESARWRSKTGHVLSFLTAGQDALLACSHNQSDEEIVEYLLDKLPDFMRDDARELLVEAQVDRYVGALNAMPGGWHAHELKKEHQPEPKDHPGLFVAGDFFFDSTLNAALISASVATEMVCDLFKAKVPNKLGAAARLLEGSEL